MAFQIFTLENFHVDRRLTLLLHNQGTCQNVQLLRNLISIGPQESVRRIPLNYLIVG